MILHADSPTAAAGPTGERTLVDELLEEQQQLTAAEAFSRAHDRHELSAARYRKLLPLTAPASGQQFAFEVDLDQCSGCKACVTACHSLNGLDDDETWRSVGRLASTGWRAPLQQFVTTACHHCVDPGCLNGCPVLAYDKDPITGIVRHLDDQCIGCQYCVMKCPYEVPQYSRSRGIVRKCDMCSSRLAVGEAPACVQACPNEAIRITMVETAKVRGKYRPRLNFGEEVTVSGKVSKWVSGKLVGCDVSHSPAHPLAHSPANAFLPDSPNPAITLPTTRYISQRALPAGLEAADAHEVRPARAHPPLTFMLVLSQCGVGLALMDALTGGASRLMSLSALAVTALGVAAGTLHLGQPLKAWRSFLGWRKSWLSRELIAFGASIGALSLQVVLLRRLTAWFAVLTGLVAVACSVMVYVDTRRPFWSAPMTFGKFFGTTLLLGVAGSLVLRALAFPPSSFKVVHTPTAAGMATIQGVAFAAIAIGIILKFTMDNRALRFHVNEQEPHLTALNKTALLLNGQFGLLSRCRVVCGLTGGVVLLTSALVVDAGIALPAVALALCFAAELIERHLFFVAEVAPKMPGGRGE